MYQKQMDDLENIEKIIKILKINNDLITELKQLSKNMKQSNTGRTISSVIRYIEDMHEICNKIEELEVL